jgi:hypothetical protein
MYHKLQPQNSCNYINKAFCEQQAVVQPVKKFHAFKGDSLPYAGGLSGLYSEPPKPILNLQPYFFEINS